MRTGEDALSEDQFEHLVESLDRFRNKSQKLEAKFILFTAGRLGMRAGEISHIKKDWINFKKDLIKIPPHEPCDCGYCRQRAISEYEHNDNLTLEQAMERRWHPKTDHAIRSIPYDWSDRVKKCILEFFDIYDKFPIARNGVNRRVKKLAKLSDLDKNIYPHSLRATAGTFHAYNGLSITGLLNLMGWSDLKIAQKYIRVSGGATQRDLNRTYKDKRENNKNNIEYHYNIGAKR